MQSVLQLMTLFLILFCKYKTNTIYTSKNKFLFYRSLLPETSQTFIVSYRAYMWLEYKSKLWTFTKLRGSGVNRMDIYLYQSKQNQFITVGYGFMIKILTIMLLTLILVCFLYTHVNLKMMDLNKNYNFQNVKCIYHNRINPKTVGDLPHSTCLWAKLINISQ